MKTVYPVYHVYLYSTYQYQPVSSQTCMSYQQKRPNASTKTPNSDMEWLRKHWKKRWVSTPSKGHASDPNPACKQCDPESQEITPEFIFGDGFSLEVQMTTDHQKQKHYSLLDPIGGFKYPKSKIVRIPENDHRLDMINSTYHSGFTWCCQTWEYPHFFWIGVLTWIAPQSQWQVLSEGLL